MNGGREYYHCQRKVKDKNPCRLSFIYVEKRILFDVWIYAYFKLHILVSLFIWSSHKLNTFLKFLPLVIFQLKTRMERKTRTSMAKSRTMEQTIPSLRTGTASPNTTVYMNQGRGNLKQTRVKASLEISWCVCSSLTWLVQPETTDCSLGLNSRL